MTVTFFINYLNHHQLPVADELYRLLGENFHFVATFPRNPEELKGGEDYSPRQYCLLPSENSSHKEKAIELNLSSDVCVYGAGNLDWERERAKTDKLSFEISERWFKRGLVNVLSPRLLKWWWLYQTKLRNKPFYKLCASAFTASDCRKLMTFRNRCYKWGYFTEIPQKSEPKRINAVPRIMWCGRLIRLKHLDHVIKVAYQLKTEGYDFSIEVYGDGVLRNSAEQLIHELSVGDCVKLMGNVPNHQILEAMYNSDIFLFTSDRHEGWGAVVNEAMSSGCCVVGSDAIGSIPFLINDGQNGLIYRDGDINSLHSKVKYLLNDPDECRKIGQQAAFDLQNVWSPRMAACNLLSLIDGLSTHQNVKIKVGPCSKAN